MAWTNYHDQLQQEMIALMTEPAWYDEDSITDRLATIRDELQTAGANVGQAPKLNPDGTIQRDAQGAILYQSQDDQLAELLSQFEQGRLASESSNEGRYKTLVEGYQNQADRLLGGVTRDANQYDAQGNLTGFGNITSGLPSYKDIGDSYGQQLDAVTSAYGTRETDVMSDFNQFGAQARQDILNQYTQQAASADQGLTNRGLGNTTVRSSVLGGVNSRQAQDLGRFDQDLARQRADLLGGLRGDQLGAQSAAAQGKANFGTQYLGAAQGLAAAPLGVVSDRTDTSPSLSDVANLSLQAGRGQANTFAMPGMQALTSYQPRSSNYSGLFGAVNA